MSHRKPAETAEVVTVPARPTCRPLAAACGSLGAALVAAAGLALMPAPAAALAQDQAQAEPDQELVGQVEDFYHYAAIANYQAAAAVGRNILDANPDSQALLMAFRQVQDLRTRRVADLDRQFERWQNQEEIADVTRQIVELVNQGRQARATDPAFIQEQIERLGQGSLAARGAQENLRNSGEFAVPQMLAYLADPNRAELHSDIRRSLTGLGVEAVNPLLAALSADDPTLVAQVIGVLGDIGYPVAVPFILEQAEKNDGPQVQQTARRALQELGSRPGASASAAYLEVAESFWLNRSPVQPDARYEGANIWRWENDSLMATTVPEQIFNEIMAMRAAANALALDGDTATKESAQSLWLASNFRREAELGAGETDETRPEGDFNASYYGTYAGVDALMDVLDRVIGERDLPPESRYDAAEVALRTIRSLRDIIGESTLPEGESPLTRAMNYPDRRVRIEAAMALAQALPTRAVSGSEQVVPLLADALSQTGEPTVLVVMADRNALNTAEEQLGEGYRVVGATSPTEAAEKASALPGVSVMVVDTSMGRQQVDELLSLSRGNPKLNGAAKLLLTETGSSEYETLTDGDPTIATAVRGGAMGDAVEQARTQVGGLPLDPEAAGDLATQAGMLLKEIGLGSSVYSLESAQPQLLAALDDDREQIRQLAAEIVALLDSEEAQVALLETGTNPDVSPVVQAAAFHGLATNAKRQGNRLGQSLDGLLDTVQNAETAEVRLAAASAAGALALPVEDARQLIIRDTKTAGEQ